MNDDKLKESVRKLFFEQHRSALDSFDSSQDSLNKAFTAILFAEIAFYMTKITPVDSHILLDSLVMFYMVGALMIVLISFAKSKVASRLLADAVEIEIIALDTEKEEVKQELLQKRAKKQIELNIKNKAIFYINEQIPIMIIMSSIACFAKACTYNYIFNAMAVGISFAISVIISLWTVFFNKRKV